MTWPPIRQPGGLKINIEAHVSTAGGISKAAARGQEIGCEAIQILGSSPQTWAFKAVPGEQLELFRQRVADTEIGPVFLHANYLINLGTLSRETLQKGIDSLINYMNLAADIGADGVIVHPGSHGGRGFEEVLPQVIEAINIVLDASPEGPCLAVENMASMGQYIGARFDELGDILNAVDSPRLKICLDAQNSFAAGYDLTNPQGIQAMLDELDAGTEWTGTITSAPGSSARKGSPPSWAIRSLQKPPSFWRCTVWKARARIGRTSIS